MINISKRLLTMISVVGLLLSIPLIAMFFTEQVDWSYGDFLIMGILLLSVVLVIEFLILNLKKPIWRIGFIIITILLFLLIWAEMAVGIFGSPIAGS